MRSVIGPGVCILFVLLLLLNGCKSYDKETEELPDTWNRGSITISADESFKPVIDALVEVYKSQQPQAEINVHYKPEAECLKDFANDSIRMVIATRGATKKVKRTSWWIR